MALSQFFNDLWNKAKSAKTFVPTYIEFSPEQTDRNNDPKEFDERQHYFMMSVSEMFLSDQRLWYQNFSPMVFTVCRYSYDGNEIEVPHVIGPSYLKNYEQKVPKGMLYLNTPVVGITPWRGDNVSLSVILCRVEETNNVEKYLNVIEDISGNFDLTSGIQQYTKIGRLLLHGLDTLLGFEQTSPLLGLNNNFGQEAGNTFKPGYHALINAENLDRTKFWVKNNKLLFGESMETANEYRDNDFVLFRIGITDTRKNLQSLPFNDEYKEIYKEIRLLKEITQKERDLLKPKLLNLSVSIKLSPDLTWADSNRIYDKKVEEINEFLDKMSKLDGEKPEPRKLNTKEQIMADALRDFKI